MSNVAHTKIEWVVNQPPAGISVDAAGRWHDPSGKFKETPGYSVNPMTGCLNQVQGICQGGSFPCFAYKLSHGRCHKADLAGLPILDYNKHIPSLLDSDPTDSFHPRVHRARFEALLNAPKGAGIFVCDRSDWAASYWPRWCQDYILDAAQKRPDIRLYLLTKQPQELPKFSPFPDNVWPGVTVTANGFAPGAYYALSRVEAKVKLIFFEPLLGCIGKDELKQLSKVSNWWIIGGQTKPTKLPEMEWVKEIVNAADKARIPVFLKNNLKGIFTDSLNPYPTWAFKDGYYTSDENPFIDLSLRQEVPEG